MATTYTLISSVTVGSGGAATIDFTSIPGTYTDLAVVVSARSVTSSEDDLRLRFNSDTGNNYTFKSLFGTGASAGSGGGTLSFAYMGVIVSSTFTANTFSSNAAYIPNYAGATYKSVSVDAVNENNATAATALLVANLWSNTAAITTITISGASGNLAQYSTAYLYGISNA
jgi:hypothetical protein